jgi:hypothetical protein
VIEKKEDYSLVALRIEKKEINKIAYKSCEPFTSSIANKLFYTKLKSAGRPEKWPIQTL